MKERKMGKYTAEIARLKQENTTFTSKVAKLEQAQVKIRSIQGKVSSISYKRLKIMEYVWKDITSKLSEHQNARGTAKKLQNEAKLQIWEQHLSDEIKKLNHSIEDNALQIQRYLRLEANEKREAKE